MLVVGLTGGIGSGKSVIAKLFAERGVPIIDADLIARKVTEPNQRAFTEIVNHFGTDILNPNGQLNRKQLRSIIFKHVQEKLWLEQLLHPLIRSEMEQMINAFPESTAYCIAVIPLLAESGELPFIHRILVVDASENAQIDRVGKRDSLTSEDILSIINAQSKRDERLAKAHDIIINDGIIADLEPKVEKLHQFYLRLSKD